MALHGAFVTVANRQGNRFNNQHYFSLHWLSSNKIYLFWISCEKCQGLSLVYSKFLGSEKVGGPDISLLSPLPFHHDHFYPSFVLGISSFMGPPLGSWDLNNSLGVLNAKEIKHRCYICWLYQSLFLAVELWESCHPGPDISKLSLVFLCHTYNIKSIT